MPSSAWSSDVCSSDPSEEHTSELQSLTNLVCRLLLEKKKAHPRALVTGQARMPCSSRDQQSRERSWGWLGTSGALAGQCVGLLGHRGTRSERMVSGAS